MRRDRLFLAVALVVAVAALAFVSCGGGGGKAKKSTPTTLKKAAAPLIWPLTGVADPLDQAKTRCAVTVKIDNTSNSLPKYGVEQADVVYEEVVEGGLTRLAAIFHSQAPTKVGSVRSVRKTDQSLVTPIGGVFAYSGGAPYAIDSINTAPVVRLDENHAGPAMFRDHTRNAPFNLYAHVDQMYARCGEPKPPPPLFAYRSAKSPVAGGAVSSVRVGFLAGLAVDWTWDAASGTWQRAVFSRHETESGIPLAPKNVVVMTVSYVGGDPRDGNIGAEATLLGSGKLQVFTAGKVITGTWTRPDRAKPAKLLDATGAEIKLAPGQTWVELPDASYPVTVTAPPSAP
ncbi:MAG TPA: DUF3048 domain-containing protein [Acidimicrobiia bacterium]|nr:DUF3048 domain-containing protein [Acidimicrobiia bacterium]